jgi:hypothetical protein
MGGGTVTPLDVFMSSPIPGANPLGVSRSPVASATAGACYDALAIVDAMEAQGLAEGMLAAVGDAIGHLGTSTLDVLKTCGVPALKMVSVKKSLVQQEPGEPVRCCCCCSHCCCCCCCCCC